MAIESDGKPSVKRGDWVRFFCDGRLVIGEVAYIISGQEKFFPYEPFTRYVTDAGEVNSENVLEERAALEDS